MKYKVGDKVKFLNDVGGGTISKIIDKETVMVLNMEGFEIPYVKNEIFPDTKADTYETKVSEPEIKEDTSKNVFEHKKNTSEVYYSNNPDVNCYLGLVPQTPAKPAENDIDVFVINDSNYFIIYNFARKEKNGYICVNGQVEPNMKSEPVFKLSPKDLKEDLNLSVQIIFFDAKAYNLKEPVWQIFNLKAVKFFKEKSFTENDFFDQDAMILTIIEENAMQLALKKLQNSELQKTVEQKESENIRLNTPKQFAKQIKETVREIDLHLHELIENESGLTNKEKLDIQMKTFRNEMDRAIKDKPLKLVFIHGVGNGILKNEIQKELQKKYSKFNFQDASFQEYGYGATMVYVR